MPTAFGHVNVFVRDIDATIAFYRLLGLDMPDAFDWPPGTAARHVEVRMPGGHYLAFDNHPMARIWNARFDDERGRATSSSDCSSAAAPTSTASIGPFRTRGIGSGNRRTTRSGARAMRSSSIPTATRSG
jgi:catechol 2,3-dioxygenase-like lactoylglutathione lyase family enzyme